MDSGHHKTSYRYYCQKSMNDFYQRGRDTQQSFGKTPASHGYYPQDSASPLQHAHQRAWSAFGIPNTVLPQILTPATFPWQPEQGPAKIGKYSFFWVSKSVFFPCLIGWGNSTSALVLTENMCWEFQSSGCSLVILVIWCGTGNISAYSVFSVTLTSPFLLKKKKDNRVRSLRLKLWAIWQKSEMGEEGDKDSAKC